MEGGRLTDFPVSLQLLPQLGQVGVPAHRGALGHRGHRQHCCQHLTQMSTSHSTVNIVNQLSTSTFSLSCQHCNLDVYSDNFHKCGQHCLKAVNIAIKLLSSTPANTDVQTLSFTCDILSPSSADKIPLIRCFIALFWPLTTQPPITGCHQLLLYFSVTK